MGNSFNIDKRPIAFIALNAFGLFIIYLLSDFITPFLGALMFYVLFTPMMEFLVEKRKWKDSTAAIVIILLSLVIILIPTIVLTNMLYGKVVSIINNPAAFISSIQLLDAKFTELTGRQLITPEMITKLQESLGSLLPSFINKIFVVVGNIGMMYFMLYYMLVQRKKMLRQFLSRG